MLDDLNRAPEAARPVVSRRRLDGLARDHRRHGRQQLLRRPLAALRHHARQCHRHRRRAGRRHGRALRRGCARSVGCAAQQPGASRSIATCWRSARARPTRSRARFPAVQRRVGGYNIDALTPGRNRLNMAHLLVGSEGTLAYSTAIELKLWPVLGRRALGACHFGSFHRAMDAAQHLVKLKPIAVELVDATMIALGARDRHVPPDARAVRARRAAGAAAGRVRRRRRTRTAAR